MWHVIVCDIWHTHQVPYQKNQRRSFEGELFWSLSPRRLRERSQIQRRRRWTSPQTRSNKGHNLLASTCNWRSRFLKDRHGISFDDIHCCWQWNDYIKNLMTTRRKPKDIIAKSGCGKSANFNTWTLLHRHADKKSVCYLLQHAFDILQPKKSKKAKKDRKHRQFKV